MEYNGYYIEYNFYKTRGDLKTDYGKPESKVGQFCYDLEEKLRNIRQD